MQIKSNFASIVQTELGLNGYYSKALALFARWTFILRGKISYINQTPFHQGAIRANLIGEATSLELETSIRTQNLISPALELYWQHQRGLIFSISYNGQFGKWYRNNELEIKLGHSF